MPTDHQTTDKWGWNGDMCAVWGKAIIIGETREEKEARARLFAAATAMLDVLKWLDRRGGLGLDVHDHIEAAIAAAEGKKTP